MIRANVGSDINVVVRYALAGVLTDTSSVVVTATAPNATSSTLTFAKTATGTYQGTLSLSQVGTWKVLATLGIHPNVRTITGSIVAV